MLLKWNQVIRNLKAPINKQSASYSRRQMEYIAILFREMLKLRQIQQMPKVASPQTDLTSYNHVDEFFYLLQSVFEQAKQRAWNNASGDAKRRLRDVMDSYDVSTAMMIDGLRRDDTLKADFKTDMQLVAKV